MPSSSPADLTNGAHEDLLERLVDGAFALTDPRGKIVKWTEGATALLGWTPAEVIGRSGFEPPLMCDQPNLGEEWSGYLARERADVPATETEVQALNRLGEAQQLHVMFLPVGLELGLEVNFFLKALALDLPRATLVDYLRREHSIVVDALTDAQQQGPESTAGKTIAGVLMLMRPAGLPVKAPEELREAAGEMRIEPVDERSSSMILQRPPLPTEEEAEATYEAQLDAQENGDGQPEAAVPVAAVELPHEDAPADLVAARERVEQARRREHEARQRVDELERQLEDAEAKGHEAKLDADRTTAELVALTEERDQLKDRLSGARSEREEARNRYEEAEAEADELRARLDEIDAEAAGRAEELQGRVDQLESEREDHEQRIKAEQERVGELEEEVAGSRKRLDTLRENLDDVNRRAGALEEDLARSAAETGELREALTSTTARADELERDANERLDQIKRFETEKLLAVERADALQSALEQVRAAALEANKWLDSGLPTSLEVVLGELNTTRDDAAQLRTRLAAGLEETPVPEAPEHFEPAAEAPAEEPVEDESDQPVVGPVIVDVDVESDGAAEAEAEADEVDEEQPATEERVLPRFEMIDHHGNQSAAKGPEPIRHGFDDAETARARIRPDGRFFQLNTAFCELLGYEESELKRAMWPPATDRMKGPQLRELTRSVLAGEKQDARVETEYLDAHGIPAKIVGTLSRVDGEPPYLELILDPVE